MAGRFHRSAMIETAIGLSGEGDSGTQRLPGPPKWITGLRDAGLVVATFTLMSVRAPLGRGECD